MIGSRIHDVTMRAKTMEDKLKKIERKRDEERKTRSKNLVLLFL
jgi:hypothetical protein